MQYVFPLAENLCRAEINKDKLSETFEILDPNNFIFSKDTS